MSVEEVNDNKGTVQLVAFGCADHLCYLCEGYQVKVLYITICTEKFQTSAENRYLAIKVDFIHNCLQIQATQVAARETN